MGFIPYKEFMYFNYSDLSCRWSRELLYLHPAGVSGCAFEQDTLTSNSMLDLTMVWLYSDMTEKLLTMTENRVLSCLHVC